MVAAVADFLVELIVDGAHRDILIAAADDRDAVRQIEMDRGRGAKIQYRTPEGGHVWILWVNVAILEFGDVEMVRDYRPAR
jgi:hypothetical protein